MQRKARVAAEQTFPMKLVKRSLKLFKVLSQKRPKSTEVGSGCTRLSWSSMRRIQSPFHPNTLYILEAERFVLEKFGFNDIFIVSKKLKRPEKQYFHPPRGAGSMAGVRPPNQAAVSKNTHFPPAPLDTSLPGLRSNETPQALSAVYLEFAEDILYVGKKKRIEIFPHGFYLEILKQLREMKYCQ